MSEIVVKTPNKDYKFIDITDENNNDEVKPLTEFFQWSQNFSEINTDETFTAPSSLSHVYFQTIKFSAGCVYIYISDESTKLENISCAMKTPYAAEPLTTSLMSSCSAGQESSSEATNDLSCKLAKRLNKQVIVALNVGFSVISASDTQEICLKLIEMALFKEIKSNPQKF